MNRPKQSLLTHVRRLSLPDIVWLSLPALAVIAAFHPFARSTSAAEVPVVLAMKDEADDARVFDDVLRDGYLALADKLADSGKKSSVSDLSYFRSKALSAARGERPEPEAIEAWALDGDTARHMAGERARLTRLLERTRVEAPLFAGRAAALQVSFDCHLAAAEMRSNGGAPVCAGNLDGALRALESDIASYQSSKYFRVST